MSKISIIAAVKNEEDFEQSLTSGVHTVFHLAPNIMTLQKNIQKARKAGKKLLIHIDLAEGLSKDKFGIQYAKELGVDGVISTRANLIKFAKEEGLFTVQRFFILDSRSVEAIAETVKSSKADMIEVMPGVVPKIIGRLKGSVAVPIIAGGLIETAEEAKAAIDSGAYAISTGDKSLWD